LATSGVPWIAIGDVSSGNGNGQVPFAIAANSGPARQGALTVGGHTVTVAQASGCTTMAPQSQDIAPAGGSGTASISTGSGWSASSAADWITLGATPASVPRGCH
jgi:hypothetical protein